MKIVFLAYEVGDAAAVRRVAMLVRGGASVRMVGFMRDRTGIPQGVDVEIIGRTEDRKLAKRALTVVSAIRRLLSRDTYRGADVILARNLEMLFLAGLTRPRGRSRPALVYETLDIHSILLGKGPVSMVLRALERRLLRDVDGVITSSPAFVEHYLQGVQHLGAPVYLAENKFTPAEPMEERPPPLRHEGPWRIGWFGFLRCQKSARFLADLARRQPSKVEVTLRGLIAEDVLPIVEAAAAELENFRYGGPYNYAKDLLGMYQSVDFCWAIDFYEEGLNSKWLLPNRLYESLAGGAVPIAVSGVTTARWLEAKGVGLVLGEPLAESLEQLFAGMDEPTLERLRAAVRAQPLSDVIVNDEGCRDLVSTFREWSLAG
jgi:hypothetical protein